MKEMTGLTILGWGLIMVVMGGNGLVLRQTSLEETDRDYLDGGILLVEYMGKEFILGRECPSGVVFKKPVKVDRICTRGSVFVRRSACTAEGEQGILGSAPELTCQNVSSMVHSLHFFAPQVEVGEGEEETKDGLEQDLQLLEKNSLLGKRQVPDPNNEGVPEEEIQETTAFPAPAKKKEGKQAEEEDEDDARGNDTGEESGEEEDEDESGEPDTFSVELTARRDSRFPLLSHMQRDAEGRLIVPQNFKPMKIASGEDQISSEREALGSWENWHDVLAEGEYHPLPEPGTLEYDVVTGGLDKWFPSRQSSPVFDTHVSLLKSVIDFELTAPIGPKGHQLAQVGGSYIVLHQYQPVNETWYQVLKKMAQVADNIIPIPIIPTRGQNDGVALVNPFRSKLFHDALVAFGYQARSLTDEDVNVGLGKEDQRAFWEEDILKPLDACILEAEDVELRITLAKRAMSNCDQIPELEAIQIQRPVWNESSKDYVEKAETINYTHHMDPNSYLPPPMARLNPRSWLFGELMWYATQLTYAYCFKPMVAGSPNGFMMAFAKMLKLFETELVQDFWGGDMGRSGGNLDVFENLLPHVMHSAYGEEAGQPNAEDFRRMLTNLDKISYALHRESLVDHWLQKPQKRRGSKEKRGRFMGGSLMKRRRRRQADGDEGGAGVGEYETTTQAETEQESGAPESEQSQVETETVTEAVIEEEAGGTTEGSQAEGEETEAQPVQPAEEEALPDFPGVEETESETTTSIPTPAPVQTTTEATPTEKAVEATVPQTTSLPTPEPTTTATPTTTPIPSSTSPPPTTTAPAPTTTTPIPPTTLQTETETTPAPTTEEIVTTPPTTTTTTEAYIPPTIPAWVTSTTVAPLHEFEVWDGLAYCLSPREEQSKDQEDSFQVKDKKWGNVRPSLEELQQYGVC